MSELGVVAALHRDTNSLSAVIPSRSLRPIEGISYGGEPPPPLSWGWFDDEGAGGSWVYNRPRGPVRQLLHDDFLHVGGKRGVSLRRAANQSITDSFWNTISWDTEDFDSDGLIAVTATTITIPAGLDGIYNATFAAAPAAGGVTYTIEGARILVNGAVANELVNLDSWAPGAGEWLTPVLAGRPLVAGDDLTFQVFQTSAASRNFTAQLDLYRTDESDYGDTPWELNDAAGAVRCKVVGAPNEGQGVARLSTPDAPGVTADLRLRKQEILNATGLAYWVSARVRLSLVGDDPTYFVGLGSLCNLNFGVEDSINWHVRGSASEVTVSGVEVAADTWYDLDFISVGNAFTAGWVNGDGPYFILGVPPVGSFNLQPTLRVSTGGVGADLDVDYMRIVTFSDYAGPADLVPSMEGIVEDAIAQA